MSRGCRASGRGFTILEVLVTVAIIAVLASLLIVVNGRILQRGVETQSVNNLRQIGLAATGYVSEHDGALPSRIRTGQKWPVLLAEYLGGGLKVYAEPTSLKTFLNQGKNPLDESGNFTSYVFNGFNDLGTLYEERMEIRLARIERPSSTLLMTIQNFVPGNYYMDYELNEHWRMLDPGRIRGGSYYLFADGAARFMTASDYDATMWLVDKDYQIP